MIPRIEVFLGDLREWMQEASDALGQCPADSVEAWERIAELKAYERVRRRLLHGCVTTPEHGRVS